MEFTGRITRLMEVREGVSMRTGNPWKTLPLIFEFDDTSENREGKHDKLYIKWEIYDKDVMSQLLKLTRLDAYGKSIVNNGYMELTDFIEARAKFRLNISTYNGRVYNDVILQNIEILSKPLGEASGTTDGNAAGTAAKPTGQEAPLNSFQELEQNGDELPF